MLSSELIKDAESVCIRTAPTLWDRLNLTKRARWVAREAADDIARIRFFQLERARKKREEIEKRETLRVQRVARRVAENKRLDDAVWEAFKFYGDICAEFAVSAGMDTEDLISGAYEMDEVEQEAAFREALYAANPKLSPNYTDKVVARWKRNFK